MVYNEAMSIDDPVSPRHIGIDSVGIGASTVNELKRLGLKIRRISGGARAVGGIDVEGHWQETTKNEDGAVRPAGPRVAEAERYADQRAQVFWRLREDLRLSRIGLPNDRRLFEQLTAIEYESPGGRITIEKKEKIKRKLGGKSPDKADAVAYGNFVRERRPPRAQTAAVLVVDRNHDDGLEKLLTHHDKIRRGEERQLERMLTGRRRKKR